MKTFTGTFLLTLQCIVILVFNTYVAPAIAQETVDMSEENLLREINKELGNIQVSLEELQNKVDEWTPTVATSPSSTLSTASVSSYSPTSSSSSTSVSTSSPTSSVSSTSVSSTPDISPSSTSVSTSTSPSTSTSESTSTSPSTSTSVSTSTSSTSTSVSTSTSPSTSTSVSTSTSSTSTSVSTSTTTATTTGPAMHDGSLRDHKITKREIDSSGTEICLSPKSPEDLCTRLILVLDEVADVTDDISDGNITEMHLKSLQQSGYELDIVVKEADEAFVESLDSAALTREIEVMEDKVSKAISTVSSRLDEGPDVLVIVLSTVGGVIFLGLVVLAIYSGRKKSQLKKKARFRKLNETTIPLQSFVEEGNVSGHDGHSNSGYIQEDNYASSTRPQQGPKQSGKPYEQQSSRGNSPSYISGNQPASKDSRHYSPKSEYSGSRPGHSRDPHYDDPYSLETRGANVRREPNPAGGLRRYDL